MLSVTYLKRMAEQAVLAFLVAFGGVALGTSGNLHKELLAGAVAAGLRAVYGLLVKNVGADNEAPSLH